MRCFSCFLAVLFTSAKYVTAKDDHTDSGIFRGSSREPPPDVFLVKRDSTHELAGVSMPEFPGLGVEARQQECPYPVMCSSQSCCPSGYKCCNAAAPPLCCPSAYACRLDVNNCCPDTAVTCGGKFCAQQGSTCCGSSICPSGTQCNTNGGQMSCCEPGELKCLGTCCPAGSQCATEVGYCRRVTVSETTISSAITTTSTSTRIIETTTTSTRTTIISSQVTSTSTTQTTETACANGVRRRGEQYDTDLQRRQNLRPQCTYECHNGQTLPVVEVPNIVGQTDQLFFSMCSGILSTSSGRGGDGSNFDVLTYKGADGKSLRRSQAKCKGYCAQQKGIFGDPATLQCDEYPPAMAAEGGKNAHRVCIPYSQNSGAQSKLFSKFVSDCLPGKGKQFIVRMKGGCNVRNRKRETLGERSARYIAARADSSSSSSFNASSNALYSWDNNTYMYIPLQDLQNGHYSIDIKFSGQVNGIQVLDSDGEEHYASGTAVSNGHVAEFDITDATGSGGPDGDDPLPAGLFLDVTKAIDVSYAAKAQLNATTQGSGAVPVTSSWMTASVFSSLFLFNFLF